MAHVLVTGGCGFIGISREPARIERLHAEGASHVFHDYLDADSFIAILHDFQPCRLTKRCS